MKELKENTQTIVGTSKQGGATTATADYDENFILKSLMSGKSRDEIAGELGHRSYKTMDMFMRRKGYHWNSQIKTYEKSMSPMEVVEAMPSNNRVHKIVSMIGNGEDPRGVSEKMEFKDHRVMAEYMKDKGYIWSTDVNNYVRLTGQIKEEQASREQKVNDKRENTTQIRKGDGDMEQLQQIEKLLPMLEMMDLNKDKLAEILGVADSGQLPRYLVPGVCATRSVYMSHALGALVKNFSLEKNITQKEVFEIALIDFLKKYGYGAEVKALINQS